MSVWLRINGYAATEIAPHTPPTWETWADGGSGSASWAFALSMRSQHQALRVGALVEILCGPMPIWTGILTEPDRTTWECSAYGLASAARKYPALDDTLASTRDLSDAIPEAQAMGWRASNPAGVSGVAAGDADGNPITLGQLLDERAEELGQRWGVDGAGRLYMRADPTAPTWLASPDSSAFGTTDEDRATRLLGRYLDSTTSTYATASAGSGAPVETLDLTPRGAMSGAEAEAILEGLLTRDRSGTAWTNGVTLTRDQITTVGGTPASLLAVRAGQMVRSFGLSYASNAFAIDTVIGKTRYTAGDHTIYVEPVNTAPRSFSDVLAAA